MRQRVLKVSGYSSVIMTHTHDDNHQNGFTQPVLAEDNASLTDENSAGRQNVTAWWRVIQMKEPQIYLVDKAGEGSSLFMVGNGWSQTRSHWKVSERECIEGKEQFSFLAALATPRYAPWEAAAFFIWCFEPARGQIQPPNMQAWFHGADGGSPFWQASTLCRRAVQGLVFPWALHLLVPPQTATTPHRGALVGDNKLQTRHQPYLPILLALHLYPRSSYTKLIAAEWKF